MSDKINVPFEEDSLDENIRHADKVIKERLLEPIEPIEPMSTYDIEYEKAIFQSLNDMTCKEQMNQEYEESIITNYNIETNSKREMFTEFFDTLVRLSKYMNDVKEVFEIIDPIIESYILGYIHVYELDTITYEKIFRVLSSVRVNKETIHILQTILLSE